MTRRRDASDGTTASRHSRGAARAISPGRPRGLALPWVLPSLLVWLLVALAAALVLNIGLGAVPIDPMTVVAALVSRGWDALMTVPGAGSALDGLGGAVDAVGLSDPLAAAGSALRVDVSRTEASVIWNIRLPRTLLAVLIGGGLGISGAALQGVFRNPLADPGIIGVSSGASVGAVAAIVLGVGWFGIWTIPLFAFVAAAVVTVIVYTLARRGGRTEVVTLILAGVAIGSVAGGTVGWLVTSASEAELRSISFWQLGSLGGASWAQVGVLAAVVGVGAATLLRVGGTLNLLTLGEREAAHLGVRVERIRVLAMVATAAMTGASVAFAGAIGFVGLVVPHLVRLIQGPEHRRLLPSSLVLGAVVLLLADLVARLAIAPMELPIGVVMGLVGGPFFAWLLVRTRREQGGWA